MSINEFHSLTSNSSNSHVAFIMILGESQKMGQFQSQEENCMKINNFAK